MSRASRATGLPLLYSAGAFAYALLYVPLFAQVIVSFSAAPVQEGWGGFSMHWYAALLNNEQVRGAAGLSVRVGAASATIAVLMGTFVAVMLERVCRGRGRCLLLGILSAPSVMPEVVTGLSLLLLFLTLEGWIGWPAGRGFSAIALAHGTFSLAYAAVVIRARLRGLDRHAELAARDLGATPLEAFAMVTLPMLAPALLVAWLLAFTLSVNDLVIASFVAGQSFSTLPMVVFSEVRLGASPQVDALACLMLSFVLVGLGLSARAVRRTP